MPSTRGGGRQVESLDATCQPRLLDAFQRVHELRYVATVMQQAPPGEAVERLLRGAVVAPHGVPVDGDEVTPPFREVAGRHERQREVELVADGAEATGNEATRGHQVVCNGRAGSATDGRGQRRTDGVSDGRAGSATDGRG